MYHSRCPSNCHLPCPCPCRPSSPKRFKKGVKPPNTQQRPNTSFRPPTFLHENNTYVRRTGCALKSFLKTILVTKLTGFCDTAYPSLALFDVYLQLNMCCCVKVMIGALSYKDSVAFDYSQYFYVKNHRNLTVSIFSNLNV